MEAIDQSPNQALALVGKHGPVRAQAFGGKVDDLVHDAGQVRVLEPGAKVGKVQRVAGVKVGVLIAAHLVFDAPGAPLGEGQLAMGAGLDAVGASHRGRLSNSSGPGVAPNNAACSQAAAVADSPWLVPRSVVVAGLDGGSLKARLREGVGHGGFGVGVVVGHCRFLSSEKNTAVPPERGGRRVKPGRSAD